MDRVHWHCTQLLDRDLEVAEEQHQTALGAHLMVVSSLLDLQVSDDSQRDRPPECTSSCLPSSLEAQRCSKVVGWLHCCASDGPATLRLPGWQAWSGSTTPTCGTC
jgi:hypothetical protein